MATTSDYGPYSARFLTALLVAFPEFADHVTRGPEPESLSIKVTAPSGSLLWIETDEFQEQITIGFASHHIHLGGWDGSVEAEDFAGAIDYVRSLIEGNSRVVEWSRDGGFAGSVTIGSDETPEPHGWFEGCEPTIRGWLS